VLFIHAVPSESIEVIRDQGLSVYHESYTALDVLTLPIDRAREVLHGASRGGDRFSHPTAGVHKISIGPFEVRLTLALSDGFCSPGLQIDVDIKKVGNDYVIHVVVYFKVGPFKKKVYEFSIKLPISDKCVCKSFNVIGIIKATFCFCIENKCIYFTYDIQSVAGNWKGKVKLLCF
jgi:hypothetical protein